MATKMVYQWGSKSYGVDAQVVGEEIHRLSKGTAGLKPERLVSVAASDESPLHPLFTWDDSEAANKYRIHEARNVINALKVTVKIEDRDVQAPAFISVGHTVETQERGEGYRSVITVVADQQFAMEAKAEALSRLRAIRQRYASLDDLAPVWRVIDEVAA